MTQKHICLMGDSIFDNDGYVPGEPGVIEQLRRSLPQKWSASKVAVDGDRIAHIAEQLENVPTHTTHIFVSIGGNDLRTFGHLLREVAQGARLEQLIASPLAEFEASYGAMLDKLLQSGLPVTACTIYTAIPFAEPEMRNHAPDAINAFNARILQMAQARSVPILRLDKICTVKEDFAEISPIEPSSQGGQKIVDALLRSLATA